MTKPRFHSRVAKRVCLIALAGQDVPTTALIQRLDVGNVEMTRDYRGEAKSRSRHRRRAVKSPVTALELLQVENAAGRCCGNSPAFPDASQGSICVSICGYFRGTR
jgi:hypothetical protein